MPASRAKWLSVPIGRTPGGTSVSATAAAAVLIVPSPPAATRAVAPVALATSAQWRSSSPGSTSRTSGSTPVPSNASRIRASAPSAEPPPRLTITTTFNRGDRSRRADPESAELVAVGIAEIGAVEGAVAVLAPNPGRTFVASAQLKRPGVEPVDLLARVHHQRHHVAVSGHRGRLVVRPGDGDARLAPRHPVEGEAALHLDQARGADLGEQGVVEAARAVEIVSPERDVADHRSAPLAGGAFADPAAGNPHLRGDLMAGGLGIGLE